MKKLYLILLLMLVPTLVQADLYKYNSFTGKLDNVFGPPDIFDVGGNVGIGTSNPQQKLDVFGIGKFNSITLRGSGSGNIFGPNGIQFDPNNSTGTSLTPKLTILQGGNVGINNTAPVTQFEVSGNSFFSNIGGNEITYDLNGSYFGAWYNTLADSTLYYGATDGIDTVPAIFPYILSLQTDTGNVGIGTAHSPSQFYVKGTTTTEGLKIPANGVANGFVWTSTGIDGSGHWATAGAASQTPWASDINGAGFKLISTGNIGIGSATPGQQLDVQGTIRTTNLTLTTGAGTLECLHRSTTGVVTGTGSDCGAGGGGSGTVNSGTANQAAYYATSTTAVSGTSNLIFNGSNVGIGSATPGQILDVQGTVRASYFNKMAITAPASSSTLTVANGKTLTANNTLTLAGTDSTTMTFPSTTATIARTDAANTFTGHQTIEGVTSTGATGTNLLVFGTAPTIANPVITNIAPAADFTLTQNSVAAITSVNSGATVNTLYLKAGNVGIGTANPGFPVDVNGGGRFLGAGDTILNPTSGNVGIGSLTPGAALDVVGSLRIIGAGITNFTSNVGIGSATPSAALDLGTAGQIVAHNTSGLGWSVHTGANTACNTTCGASACVFGFDTGLGGSDVVNCASALADTCLCSGS